MTGPILETTNLTKDFGGVRALNKVDLTVAEGELLGVIGPNGSGKTTLVNLVSGFVKPTTGQVFFQGKNITGWPPHRVTDLGLVRTFQMVRPFYKLPAFKNMIVPLTSHRVRRRVGGKYGDRDAVAKDLLEEVGFERDSAVILKTASELPHGYLKRIELARCIALEAELIILDELFSGLSLAEVATIVPVIDKLRVQGKTIIMIEHRLKELFRIADRVAVLNFGEKIAEGPPGSIMDSEAVKSAYLGSAAEE
ncbi:MAG: ABC transporter ATP-binding protein [Proteobacteria bacterium]|nr:ABC transporter ATP-binding protein [Pseudomonadota bacterium]